MPKKCGEWQYNGLLNGSRILSSMPHPIMYSTQIYNVKPCNQSASLDFSGCWKGSDHFPLDRTRHKVLLHPLLAAKTNPFSQPKAPGRSRCKRHPPHTGSFAVRCWAAKDKGLFKAPKKPEGSHDSCLQPILTAGFSIFLLKNPPNRGAGSW